jgi:hypothetical protein
MISQIGVGHGNDSKNHLIVDFLKKKCRMRKNDAAQKRNIGPTYPDVQWPKIFRKHWTNFP